MTSRPSADDRRKRDWSLTARGKAMAGKIELEYRERVIWALFDLHPDEKRQLLKAIALIEPVLRRLDQRLW